MSLIISRSIAEFLSQDLIIKINGQDIADIIDFRFYLEEKNTVVISRHNKLLSLEADAVDLRNLQFEQDIPKVKLCQNCCSFCFIDQLPLGLRKSLYFKDDDWRLSFLTGNFITLTNLINKDINRINKQRISPLFVSIHAIDKNVRNNLVGYRGMQDLALDNLRKLDEANITCHIQIVLCPTVNDGQVLMQTLSGLEKFANIGSVGIVPVGLTKYYKAGLRTFAQVEAMELIGQIRPLQRDKRKKTGRNWVYLADEFHLMAGAPIPNAAYYDDFDQLENGIGLVRKWLDDFEGLSSLRGLRLVGGRGNLKDKQFLLLTGKLFGPVLEKALRSMKTSTKYAVQVIENNFFGSKITVTGLITAQDIMRQVKPTKDPILIPDIMINQDNLFLDGLSFEQLKKRLPTARLVSSSEGLRFPLP